MHTRSTRHSQAPPARDTSSPEASSPAASQNGSQGWSPVPGSDVARASDSTTNRAAAECIALLEQGLALIEALEDEDYTASPRAFETGGAQEDVWSSPGAHTRHLLDFIDCILSGIDAQRIDYTARKRRPDIESDREAGRRAIVRAIEGLDAIRHLRGDRPLEVRPEPGQAWTRSTFARELQFVSGHAVHHHALIRMTLATLSIEAPPEFGVAPSTLAYRAEAGASPRVEAD